MNYEDVYRVLVSWMENEELTEEQTVIVRDNFSSLMETQIDQINNLLDEPEESKHYAAFIQLSILSSFISAAAKKMPKILKKFEQFLQQIISTIKKLAEKLGADSFSIGAGWPLAFSFDLSFPTKSGNP